MNLVVSASGFLGGEVCEELIAQGLPVRGMVRKTSDPARVSWLKGLGIEVVNGDLRDRASLDKNCQGVDAVIATSTSVFTYVPGENDIQRLDLQGLINLVDAARAAGVKHFIYTSFSGNIDYDFPLRNAKRAVEKHLIASGMVYTILRPSFFMEAWLTPPLGFDFPNAKATIYGSGQNSMSWISRRNVAQFAVESLRNPAAHNAILELGGPETLTPLQVVKIFEQVGGQPFELAYVPAEIFVEQQKAATDDLQKTFPGLMLAYVQGDPIDMTAIQKTFPIKLTTVQEYAQRVLTPV